MNRYSTSSGPGAIFVEAQNEDEIYADFIAMQGDEEDSPRQPAPEPLPVVEQAFLDVHAGRLDTDSVHAVMGRRVGTIDQYRRLKDLYDVAVLAVLHSRER